MLAQERLIARVRDLCIADDRLAAALTYGSMAQGVGDRYSDIEFWLFTAGAAGAAGAFDARAWCAQITPNITAITINEYGAHVVFFPGLIRGEFHFADDVNVVREWPARGASVDAMIVKDRDGTLWEALTTVPMDAPVPVSAGAVEELCLRYANWLILAINVAARGEEQRAHDALGHIRRHLIWMARLDAGATRTWLTPSRCFEAELPIEMRDRLRATTVSDVDAAIAAAWLVGAEVWRRLAVRFGFQVPVGLFQDLQTPRRS